MRFVADLHIHSRFSRATSKDLDVKNILRSALRKGLSLVATGDFTHPAWFQELTEQLKEDGSGLLRPKKEVLVSASEGLPANLLRDVKFILEVEISSIYKAYGKVRKVHTLVYMPSFESARRFAQSLGRLGNIASDGRPIVGLDPQKILEIAKNADDRAFLVPAHIWTPHFSLFGSESGFDSIEECFGEATGQIFALETGLSSDIVMNRRWSALDRFALVSSSDAHSPSKLGREATIFGCELLYDGVLKALRGHGGLSGTIEFFPEEGKYHLDGHRKCNARMSPEETRRFGGRCPVCGQPVTRGVLGRVEALADREVTQVPAHFPPQTCLIPLEEILSEIYEQGCSSKAVQSAYEALIGEIGAEIDCLAFCDLSAFDGFGLLKEAIKRMREGRVRVSAGYDGEYGEIRVFDPQEIKALKGQGFLFDIGSVGAGKSLFVAPAKGIESKRDLLGFKERGEERLSKEQEEAVSDLEAHCLVVAGPGTGKTKTIVARAQRTLKAFPHARLLVLTFTNKAAEEIKARLDDGVRSKVFVGTFHAYALKELARIRSDFRIVSQTEIVEKLRDVVPEQTLLSPPDAQIVDWEGRLESPEIIEALLSFGISSLPFLVPMLLHKLRSDEGIARAISEKNPFVLVDEFQDVSADQFFLLLELIKRGCRLFAVGDPDQNIYAFRGTFPKIFEKAKEAIHGLKVFELFTSFRVPGKALDLAKHVLKGASLGSAEGVRATRKAGQTPKLFSAKNRREETSFVARKIYELVGGLLMHEERSGAVRLAPGQIAVLARTHETLAPFVRAIEASGIPCWTVLDRPMWEVPLVQDALSALQIAPPDCDALQCIKDIVAGSEEDTARRVLLGFCKGKTAKEALDNLLISRDTDSLGYVPEKVLCLTMHAAKGLEADCVFVVGLEDGIMPLDGSKLDEEKRLLYVTLTRTRDVLYLTCSNERMACPFLDLDRCDRISWKEKPRQMTLF
jgi:DNA helicase-2/ATP-dependent DNA helicase PcrA